MKWYTLEERMPVDGENIVVVMGNIETGDVRFVRGGCIGDTFMGLGNMFPMKKYLIKLWMPYEELKKSFQQ